MKHIIFLMLAIFLIGCTQETANYDAEDSLRFAASNNKFAIDFYKEIKETPGNILYSPYSIETAFAMVYEGAQGTTEQEMKTVFHYSEKKEQKNAVLAFKNKLANHEIDIANAAWVQKEYELSEQYLTSVKDYGEVKQLDFYNSPEAARKTINQWTEQHTNGKIKELFPEKTISRSTRLALTNAVYFKGKWKKQFDEKYTKSLDFRTSSGAVKAEMMHQMGGETFSYAETEQLQILELMYDDSLSMIILLPREEGQLEQLEQSLSTQNLNQWDQLLIEQKVAVIIPKFTFTKKYSLNDALATMGIPSAFSEKSANFSGINEPERLFIQTAVHQAFIDVNEEGTEASAATGISMGVTTSIEEKPTALFNADHPFIFIIREKETGAILFMGRVVDPIHQ